MKLEIGADAALFPEKEYINGIAVAVLNVRLLISVEVKQVKNISSTSILRKINVFTGLRLKFSQNVLF